MSKYTLHNKNGDYMAYSTTSLVKAKKECDSVKYDATVMEEYHAKSPWSEKITAHAKKVYRNYAR